MKLSIVLTLFLGVLLAFFGDALMLMTVTTSILIFPINIGSSLQTDESSKWNKLEITMPVSRQTIISCKYISFAMLILVGLLFAVALILVSMLFGNKIHVSFFPFSYGLSLAMLTVSFTYPLLLKFGAPKSETIIVMSAIIAVALIFVTWFVVRKFFAADAILSSLSVNVANLVVSSIFFAGSYFLSVYMHGKKEF